MTPAWLTTRHIVRFVISLALLCGLAIWTALRLQTGVNWTLFSAQFLFLLLVAIFSSRYFAVGIPLSQPLVSNRNRNPDAVRNVRERQQEAYVARLEATKKEEALKRERQEDGSVRETAAQREEMSEGTRKSDLQRIRDTQQKHLEQKSKAAADSKLEKDLKSVIQKLSQMERSRLQSSSQPVFPGEELAAMARKTSEERQEIQKQQDAELQASLQKDRDRESAAKLREREAAEAAKAAMDLAEERKKYRERQVLSIPPEPHLGAEDRLVVAVDLEKRGRFKRSWLKSNKLQDLFAWVETLEAMADWEGEFMLCTVYPRVCYTRKEHGRMSLEEIELPSHCVLRMSAIDAD